MLTRNDERTVVIDGRYCGLPDVAYGGYVAGVLAAAAGGVGADVRLRRPVPTGRPLTLEPTGGGRVELREGDALLAEGAPAAVALELPLPVGRAEAEAASARFPGHDDHPFPECFGCGPARHGGDGLRIFPGPVAGRRLVAASWVPPAEAADHSGRIPPELVWAALDCPQLWSLIVHTPAGAPERVLTAGITARLERPVWAGEPHVVLGWPLGREGRTCFAGAAVLGPAGELCAIGRQAAVGASWGVPIAAAPRNPRPNFDARRNHP